MIQIHDLLGKKYVPHGRGSDGYDCYGLAIEVRKRFGKPIADVWYEIIQSENTCSLIEFNKKLFCAEKVITPEQSDIVVIKVGGTPSHIGVVLSKSLFIHVMNNVPVVVERLSAYKSRIEGFYRW